MRCFPALPSRFPPALVMLLVLGAGVLWATPRAQAQSVNAPGSSSYLVTEGGEVRATIYGADGGDGTDGTGGSGAEVSASFQVQAGDELTLVVGAAGENGAGIDGGGGGGGGSALLLARPDGTEAVLLAAGAGGGGGGSDDAFVPDNYRGRGGSSSDASSAGGGSASGLSSEGGGGGGGFSESGADGGQGDFEEGGGRARGGEAGQFEGGNGGTSTGSGGRGGFGFGGGGGAYEGGGGGGGYSGGEGGLLNEFDSSPGGGGGGASFVNSTFVVSTEPVERVDGEIGASTGEDGSVSLSGDAVLNRADDIYVDASAGSDSNAGGSWAQAFQTFNRALSVADGNDEVRLAAGTYFPDRGPGTQPSDRAASFVITGEQDGLEVYGGYPSGGGARDVDANETVLSGNIGASGDASDNSRHVVVLDGGNRIGPAVAANVTRATVLNGLTVTGGYADGVDNDSDGAGLYCDGSGSGNACSPTLRRLTFRANRALDSGGAFYGGGLFGGVSNPLIAETVFEGNRARSGGAMLNSGFQGQSSPEVRRSVFVGNYSDENGGALYNYGVGGESSPTLVNALFLQNSAGRGGALYNDGTGGGTSSPSVVNATFTENEARANAAGAIYSYAESGGTSSPRVANAIFYGNEAAIPDNDAYDRGSASTSVEYALFGDGACPAVATCTNLIGGDPQFIDASSPRGSDGVFGTRADGLRLMQGSPALDAGSNAAVPSDATTDLAGSERIVDNGSGSARVDLGAYEALESVRIPVELTSFEASADGSGSVRLVWQTATEDGNDRFEVERRRDSTSSVGAAWRAVATVETQAPGGTSSEQLSYRATDAQLPFEAEALTYRLVQIDRDGTREVVGKRVVEVGAPERFRLHGVFPNPVRSQATIRYELPAEEQVTVSVYDALGRKVRTLVAGEQQQRGRKEVAFDAAGLSSGTYFYRLEAGGQMRTESLVLVR